MAEAYLYRMGFVPSERYASCRRLGFGGLIWYGE